jgi:DNA-binding beta-propeller fold protein YncE
MHGIGARISVALGLILALAPLRAGAAVDRGIYADYLASGWENWSYGTVIDLENLAPVHGGAYSIAASVVQPYGGLSLRVAPPIATAGYSAIRFWVYGGLAGNSLSVYTQATDDGGESASVPVTATDGLWTRVVVPLTSLGSPAQIARIAIQDATGNAGAPTFFVDDVDLVGTGGSPFPDPVATRVLGQSAFDTSSDGLTASRLHGPAGVAVGPDGRLFVVDFFNHRVLSWSLAAAFVNGQPADLVLGQANFDSNETSAAANRMYLPESVAVDASGNVYVADTYNQRVMVFEPPLATNMSATTFGSNGCEAPAPAPGQFCFPRGVAVDASGNLFVADEFRNRVAMYATPLASGDFDPDGAIEGLGEPRGVAVDASGTLFATDSENDRVLYYLSPLTTDTVADGTIGTGPDGVDCETQTNGQGVTASTLACPIDLAVDRQGNLFVSDLYNHRILAFADPVGGDAVADAVYGQQGSFTTGTPNQGGLGAASMRTPLGIAFDPLGGLLLADFDNNRVLAYPAPAPEPGAGLGALAGLLTLRCVGRRRARAARRAELDPRAA